MLKHLFKLIWNQKKRNFLLMLEMTISFLVMFAVFTMVVYYYHNYKTPVGIDYKQIWAISYNNKPDNKDSLPLFYNTLRKHLLSMSQIEAVSFSSGNYPFSYSTSSTGLKYKGKNISGIYNYTVEDDYVKTTGMKVLAGRWFLKTDDVARVRPVVINETLKSLMFGKGEAVGQMIDDYDQKNQMQVIGVVQDMKDKSEFTAPTQGIFFRVDSTSISWMDVILIKVKPGTDAAFESKLFRSLSSYIKNANIEINHLDNQRREKNRQVLVPIVLLMIVGGFLVINVALGLFGVLWYNINKRKGEIGLRRAVGAPGATIYKQLLGEAMILATISLLVGVFFAAQFPLLNIFSLPVTTYLTAIVLSVLFIYLLVILCALYPGKQAAGIYPAVALHED
ncbi:MAG: ABC transporter permease [Chitinophagaceae bacterium]